MFSQNTNCNAKLEVINNKSSKKAGESGTSYRLKLTNTGFDSSTYKIRVINDNASKKAQFTTSYKKNTIDIKGEFYNVSLKKMKPLKNTSTYNYKKGDNSENEIEISLKGKESKTFIVKMKTPPGARIGSINKSQVQVTSKKCNNNTIAVLLETQIIDGE